MKTLPTELAGLVHLAPTVHGDARGFFVETWRQDAWAAVGVDVDFVQDNHSRSRQGTVRGMHYQLAPGQAKLLRCARGEILDVAVDLRRGSETFGRWEAIRLDDVEGHQLFVPVGFAHGFCVLSEIADVAYKVSSYFDPGAEAGFAYDDPDVGIAWPGDLDLLVSERDARAPRLAEVADRLPF